jgi:hypothetical protein
MLAGTASNAQTTNPSINGFSKPELMAGQEIHVNGVGFDKTMSVVLESDRAKLKRPVQVRNLTASGFDFTVPADLTEERYKVIGNANEQYFSGPTLLTVHQAPTISSASLASVVPGGTITISGAGFSPRPEENTVMFNSYNGVCLPNPSGLNPPYYDGTTGSYKGAVMAASPSELTVQAPQELMQYISMLCPVPCHITAVVRGVPAQGQIDVLVGSLNFPH